MSRVGTSLAKFAKTYKVTQSQFLNCVTLKFQFVDEINVCVFNKSKAKNQKQKHNIVDTKTDEMHCQKGFLMNFVYFGIFAVFVEFIVEYFVFVGFYLLETNIYFQNCRFEVLK